MHAKIKDRLGSDKETSRVIRRVCITAGVTQLQFDGVISVYNLNVTQGRYPKSMGNAEKDKLNVISTTFMR